jgi:7,8-dihydro-6-hydroxymethylpterin-pyrophosphokinase
MEKVFLSLGSNLGDRLANLRLALAALGQFSSISALSDAFETQPVGYTEQPWFINAVVEIVIDNPALRRLAIDDRSPDHPSAGEVDSPHRLLARLLSIERSLGRRRQASNAIPKGPRTLDLDILLYGSRVIQSSELTIPHPAMHVRRFVLQPLAQIAPLAQHPVLHQSALQLLQALPAEGPLVRSLGPLLSSPPGSMRVTPD